MLTLVIFEKTQPDVHCKRCLEDILPSFMETPTQLFIAGHHAAHLKSLLGSLLPRFANESCIFTPQHGLWEALPQADTVLYICGSQITVHHKVNV